MTVFRQTADASGLYREATGDQYARIVSSTESGNFVDEKNGVTLSAAVVVNPMTMLRSIVVLTNKIG
ncbi:hypothetical protein [Bradyrhizobium sp. Ash2021]|uniref:hypothetical protein n=1 Tax=Bradyrhizobium sp. Ash2021 TaxID=2954771 RepID=UPI0028153BC6|nr:hypothetical protein [Bradyrhizobium sp. Ash2021]WMT78751.1 hypothetical protein NL528_21470 [Bradyrhizobium sp. Ash2021]